MLEKNNSYFQDLHLLRGVAILSIVISHASDTYLYYHQQIAGEYEPGRLLTAINEVLWHDTTIYFTLISGLLFSTVLASRGWTAFFYGRARNVLLPYMAMSALFTLIDYHIDIKGNAFYVYNYGFFPYLKEVLKNILLGKASFPYWYIPILFFLYLLTPVVYLIARRISLLIMIIAILPLFFSRTLILLSPQSVIFFLGAYATGIYFGINYKENISYLRSRIVVFATIAAITTILLLIFYINEWSTDGLVSIEESLFYLQKFSLTALFLVVLNNYQNQLPSWLGVFAKYAFTIFFIHTFFLHILTSIALALVPPPVPTTGLILVMIVILIIGMLICVGISTVLKHVFGRYSRMLIGA